MMIRFYKHIRKPEGSILVVFFGYSKQEKFLRKIKMTIVYWYLSIMGGCVEFIAGMFNDILLTI